MDGLINNTVCVFLDLYYNENYAGLAAEIFGLAEPVDIQNDDADAAITGVDDNVAEVGVSSPQDESQLVMDVGSSDNADPVTTSVIAEEGEVNDQLVPTVRDEVNVSKSGEKLIFPFVI